MLKTLFERTEIHSNPLTIDLIRGLAVLLVFLSHADAYGTIKLWPFYLTGIKGWIGQLGVYMFFIVSGMLIWHSAENNLRQNKLLTYFINRVTRILPLYLVCILFVVGIQQLLYRHLSTQHQHRNSFSPFVLQSELNAGCQPFN